MSRKVRNTIITHQFKCELKMKVDIQNLGIE